MGILFRSVSFVATMVIGAIAFAATAIEFPAVMRELIALAQQLPGYLSSLGINDTYMVWMDILLSGDKLVLLGFILATRIIFAIVGGVFGSRADDRTPRASLVSTQRGAMSPFNGWGESR